MYLFPRQYGLYNVFTSVGKRQETVQPLQAVPKRLNGKVLALVVKMQKLHRGCSFHALINHYCPVSHVSGTESFMDYGTPHGEVCGFVSAVIKRVIPHGFFGGTANRKLVMHSVD